MVTIINSAVCISIIIVSLYVNNERVNSENQERGTSKPAKIGQSNPYFVVVGDAVAATAFLTTSNDDDDDDEVATT